MAQNIDELRRELAGKLRDHGVPVEDIADCIGMIAEYTQQAYVQGHDNGYDAGYRSGHEVGTNARISNQSGTARPQQYLGKVALIKLIRDLAQLSCNNIFHAAANEPFMPEWALERFRALLDEQVLSRVFNLKTLKATVDPYFV